jgi:phosphoribosylformimino-5-aminoimidazole carboxamide ribotide isomerase
MIVIPSIDLLDGKVVRLREGRREDATVYSDDPLAVAADFRSQGAGELHVVDLDGAFGERRQQTAIPAPIQLGGGLRDRAAVEAALLVAERAVLGTAAVRDEALTAELCRTHPGRIVVAVDARDGKVATDGWTRSSDVDAVDLARRARDWGAARILYTDIARDGLRSGVNLAATAALQRAVGELPVIASGGVSSLDDLRALHEAGVKMCVVGRAIYEKSFTVAEAIAACR